MLEIPHRIRVIDSHTGGEPTRVVIEGGPDLGEGPIEDRVVRFRENFDHFRSAVANEPRASDTVVGALLCAPHRADCQFGVIFFNNVGCLRMCGHGTIGLVVTLAHLGRIGPGVIRIDTPVGVVETQLRASGEVSMTNVPSFRQARDVTVPVRGLGDIRGDVAFGGNWFFLVADHGLEIDLKHHERLNDYCGRVREAVVAQGFAEVDHVELFGPAASPGANARNYVLCPGKAYDRSPCGTGTSAKLACLAADGKLGEGEPWVQESIIGSRFTGTYRWLDRAKGVVSPTITGTAHINAESTFLVSPEDPFGWGIRAATATLP
jgi:4-hydroxyproline epimerase